MKDNMKNIIENYKMFEIRPRVQFNLWRFC